LISPVLLVRWKRHSAPRSTALDVKGKRHIANVRDPQIPAALAPAIEGIVSLNDFDRAHSTPFPIDGFTFLAVAPADLATIYQFNPLFSFGITGQGQTIALIEDTDVYNPNDLADVSADVWAQCLPWRVRSRLCIRAACPDPGTNGNDFEAILDTEWASAAAPQRQPSTWSPAQTPPPSLAGSLPCKNLINQPSRAHRSSASATEAVRLRPAAAANAAYKTVYLQGGARGGVSLRRSRGQRWGLL